MPLAMPLCQQVSDNEEDLISVVMPQKESKNGEAD